MNAIGRMPLAEVVAHAVAIGARTSPDAIRLRRRRGESDAQIAARLSDEAAYWLILGEHGIRERDPRAVAADLRATGWDGREAAHRSLAEMRQAADRRTKSCTVTVRPSDRPRARLQARRCNCQRCHAWIVESLRPFWRAMIARRPWLRDLDTDLEQEAAICAIKAVAKWDGVRPLDAFYAMVFDNHFRNIRRDAYAACRLGETVSLDGGFVGGDDADRVLALIERIPDRCASVETIALARERLREFVAAARERIASAGDAFDARVATGAVA